MDRNGSARRWRLLSLRRTMPSRTSGRAFFLDFILSLGYTVYRKWCYRQTVRPLSYREVTASLRDGRLLLFISNDLNDQSEKRDDEGTKLKQLGPCNHFAHPLFLRIGGKRRSPPKKRGKPPTVTGSTTASIPQNFRQSKSVCSRKQKSPRNRGSGGSSCYPICA